MTQDIYIKVVLRYPWILQCVPDHFKMQEMCNVPVLEDSLVYYLFFVDFCYYDYTNGLQQNAKYINQGRLIHTKIKMKI